MPNLSSEHYVPLPTLPSLLLSLQTLTPGPCLPTGHPLPALLMLGPGSSDLLGGHQVLALLCYLLKPLGTAAHTQ